MRWQVKGRFQVALRARPGFRSCFRGVGNTEGIAPVGSLCPQMGGWVAVEVGQDLVRC